MPEIRSWLILPASAPGLVQKLAEAVYVFPRERAGVAAQERRNQLNRGALEIIRDEAGNQLPGRALLGHRGAKSRRAVARQTPQPAALFQAIHLIENGGAADG